MSIAKLRTWAALSCAAAIASACGSSPVKHEPAVEEKADAAAAVDVPVDDDESPVTENPDIEPLLPVVELIGTEGGKLSLEGIAEVRVPREALIEDAELQ